MFPRTKTGTKVRSDVPPEWKPERGYVRMFPRNENRNEGTFGKTTLLRNRLFVSQWHFFVFGHVLVTFSGVSVAFLVTFFPKLLLWPEARWKSLWKTSRKSSDSAYVRERKINPMFSYIKFFWEPLGFLGHFFFQTPFVAGGTVKKSLENLQKIVRFCLC